MDERQPKSGSFATASLCIGNNTVPIHNRWDSESLNGCRVIEVDFFAGFQQHGAKFEFVEGHDK